jgi:hypothetical protein
MKRLNAKTGIEYQKGEIRKDGFIFRGYSNKKHKKTGLFVEYWLSPKAAEFAKTQSKIQNRSIHRISWVLLRNAKRRADLKQGIVELDLTWAEEKLNIGVCELTKLPFDFSAINTHSANLYAPSLDRIDSKNPNYTKANTRVVLWGVNRALGENTLLEILPILKAMIENQ